MKLLLKAGIDHTSRDRANNTPADIALYFANQRMIDLLADWAARDSSKSAFSALPSSVSASGGASIRRARGRHAAHYVVS